MNNLLQTAGDPRKMGATRSANKVEERMAIGDTMRQDALEAQKLTRKFFVVELDFTRESLAELDELFDSVDVYLKDGLSEENVELLTRTWGAYLGEVLRRESAGEWAEDQSAPRGVTLGEAWRPHERVRKRLLEGAEHGLVEYADEVLG